MKPDSIQEYILSQFEQNKNIFITGKAGSGKSFIVRKIRILLHIAHADPRRNNTIALIGFNQASHDFHQSRFTRSVSSHQRETIARLNNEA